MPIIVPIKDALAGHVPEDGTFQTTRNGGYVQFSVNTGDGDIALAVPTQAESLTAMRQAAAADGSSVSQHYEDHVSATLPGMMHVGTLSVARGDEPTVALHLDSPDTPSLIGDIEDAAAAAGLSGMKFYEFRPESE